MITLYSKKISIYILLVGYFDINHRNNSILNRYDIVLYLYNTNVLYLLFCPMSVYASTNTIAEQLGSDINNFKSYKDSLSYTIYTSSEIIKCYHNQIKYAYILTKKNILYK